MKLLALVLVLALPCYAADGVPEADRVVLFSDVPTKHDADPPKMELVPAGVLQFCATELNSCMTREAVLVEKMPEGRLWQSKHLVMVGAAGVLVGAAVTVAIVLAVGAAKKP